MDNIHGKHVRVQGSGYIGRVVDSSYYKDTLYYVLQLRMGTRTAYPQYACSLLPDDKSDDYVQAERNKLAHAVRDAVYKADLSADVVRYVLSEAVYDVDWLTG